MDYSYEQETGRIKDIGLDLNNKIRLGINTEFLDEGINISMLSFPELDWEDEVEPTDSNTTDEPEGVGVNIPFSEKEDLIKFLKGAIEMLETLPEGL